MAFLTYNEVELPYQVTDEHRHTCDVASVISPSAVVASGPPCQLPGPLMARSTSTYIGVFMLAGVGLLATRFPSRYQVSESGSQSTP